MARSPMNKLKVFLLSSLICLVGGGATSTPAAVESNAADYYLFTSFRGNGEDGLHLALSTDGWHWSAVGGDRSFLRPSVGKGRLMRDPCLVEGPDGTFHLVWTTGWTDQTIGYANSKNLVDWSPQQALPVMVSETTARNAWAPELFFDQQKRDWLIFWATTIPGRFPETDQTGNSGLNHRIYFTRTNDFKTFSPTALLFDPGFNVIDGTIIKSNSKFVMIFKDERQVPVKKNLRLRLLSGQKVLIDRLPNHSRRSGSRDPPPSGLDRNGSSISIVIVSIATVP